MDLEEIVKEDNEKIEKEISINDLKKDLKDRFGSKLVVDQNLINKFKINKSYRDEIHKYFTKNNFNKTNTDNNGEYIVDDPDLICYKRENTYIKILFNVNGELEEEIQIKILQKDVLKSLFYKVNDDVMDLLNENKNKNITLKGMPLLYDNYKNVIDNCNTLEDLKQLEYELEEDIKLTLEKGSRDINSDYIYELKNHEQFATFESAFKEL